jgi:hypothetical protein
VRVILVLALAAILAAMLGGCRGDPVKCEKACRNYGTLVYKKNAAIHVANEPESTRDELREKLERRFPSELEKGVDLCVSQCESANNDDDVNCMIAAKTGDQAVACFE